MNKIKTFISLLILAFTSALAAHAETSPASAICGVFTYNADGTLYGSAHGFFISADGTGIAPYEIFQNAYRAEVETTDGKKYEVYRIGGASSVYNLVKFTLKNAKTNALQIVSSPVAQGKALRIVTTAATKDKSIVSTTAQKVSDFNDYKFYDLAASNENNFVGCPVIDEKGNVVGIVQKNLTKNALTACAIDARTVNTLVMNSVGSINFDLRKINIPKALPTDEKEAVAFIYMMSHKDTVAYATALNDFIETFPFNAEGYVNRAKFYAEIGKYGQSLTDFNTALNYASNSSGMLSADGVHHSLGKTICEVISRNNGQDLDATWSYANAISEEEKAFAIAQNPLYQQQKGLIQFEQKDYQGAYECFQYVNNSDLASPQSFYYTAFCKEKLGGSKEEILVLLDSAVAHLDRPYTASQAQYLYMRAIQEIKMQKYHAAALDFYEYEKAIGPNNLTAQFYYTKEQAEREARMYQQALEDIRTAQAKSEKPDYYLYRLEEASLLLQVGMFDEAITTSQDLLKELPESSDCYKIIGIAYGEKKEKSLAAKNLNKAKSLGDTTVDALIKKYK